MKLFNRHWLKAVAAVAITAQIFTVFPAIKASEIESGAKQDSQAEENTNEALTELKTDDTDEDLTLLSTDDTDEDLTLLSTDNTDEDLTLLNTDNTDEDLTLLSTDNTDEDLILLNTDEQKISESEKSPVDFDDLKKVQPGQEAKVEVKLSYLKGGRPVTDTNISYPDYGNPDGQINFSVRINYKVTIYDFDGRYEPGSVEIRIPRVFGAAPTVGGEEFETAGYEGPGDETVLFKNRGILEQGDAGFFDVTYSFKPREIPKTDGGGLLIQNDIKAAVTAYYSGGAIYNAETSALNVEVQTLKDEVYLLKSVSPPNQTAFTSTQFYSWLKDKNSGDYWFVTFNMDLNFMAKTNMFFKTQGGVSVQEKILDGAYFSDALPKYAIPVLIMRDLEIIYDAGIDDWASNHYFKPGGDPRLTFDASSGELKYTLDGLNISQSGYPSLKLQLVCAFPKNKYAEEGDVDNTAYFHAAYEDGVPIELTASSKSSRLGDYGFGDFRAPSPGGAAPSGIWLELSSDPTALSANALSNIDLPATVYLNPKIYSTVDNSDITLVSDFLELKPNGSPGGLTDFKPLGDGDYYIKSFEVKRLIRDLAHSAEVWIKTGDPEGRSWTLYGSRAIPAQDNFDTVWIEELPAGLNATAVKLVYKDVNCEAASRSEGWTPWSLGLTYQLIKSADYARAGALRELAFIDVVKGGASLIEVSEDYYSGDDKNEIDRVIQRDMDVYEGLRLRAKMDIDLGSRFISAVAPDDGNQEFTYINNNQESYRNEGYIKSAAYRLCFGIDGIMTFPLSGITIATVLPPGVTMRGFGPSREDFDQGAASFFDIEPKGLDRAERNLPQLNYTAEFTDNYKGSGRQRVAIRVPFEYASDPRYYGYFASKGFELEYYAVYDIVPGFYGVDDIICLAWETILEGTKPEDLNFVTGNIVNGRELKTLTRLDIDSNRPDYDNRLFDHMDFWVLPQEEKTRLGNDTSSGIWDDLNENGTTDELAIGSWSGFFRVQSINDALATGAQTLVKTLHTGGTFAAASDIAQGEEYEAALRYLNKDGAAKNVCYYYAIPTPDNNGSQWAPIFKGMGNLSHLDSHHPTVYYSNVSHKTSDNLSKYTDSSWIKADSWTLGLEAVKAVCVALDDTPIVKGSITDVYLKLQAPADATGVNAGFFSYTRERANAVDSYEDFFDENNSKQAKITVSKPYAALSGAAFFDLAHTGVYYSNNLNQFRGSDGNESWDAGWINQGQWAWNQPNRIQFELYECDEHGVVPEGAAPYLGMTQTVNSSDNLNNYPEFKIEAPGWYTVKAVIPDPSALNSGSQWIEWWRRHAFPYAGFSPKSFPLEVKSAAAPFNTSDRLNRFNAAGWLAEPIHVEFEAFAIGKAITLDRLDAGVIPPFEIRAEDTVYDGENWSKEMEAHRGGQAEFRLAALKNPAVLPNTEGFSIISKPLHQGLRFNAVNVYNKNYGVVNASGNVLITLEYQLQSADGVWREVFRDIPADDAYKPEYWTDYNVNLSDFVSDKDFMSAIKITYRHLPVLFGNDTNNPWNEAYAYATFDLARDVRLYAADKDMNGGLYYYATNEVTVEALNYAANPANLKTILGAPDSAKALAMVKVTPLEGSNEPKILKAGSSFDDINEVLFTISEVKNYAGDEAAAFVIKDTPDSGLIWKSLKTPAFIIEGSSEPAPDYSVLYNTERGGQFTTLESNVPAGAAKIFIVPETAAEVAIVFVFAPANMKADGDIVCAMKFDEGKLEESYGGILKNVAALSYIESGEAKSANAAADVYTQTPALLKEVFINREPDNGIDDDGGYVIPGDILTYRITVANNSSAPLPWAAIEDIMPNDTEFIETVSGLTPDQITGAADKTTALRWMINGLAAKSETRFIFKTRVLQPPVIDLSQPRVDEVKNAAKLYNDERFGFSPTKPFAEHTVVNDMVSLVNIRLDNAPGFDEILSVGDKITYKISVTNVWNEPINDLAVTDVLPPGIRYRNGDLVNCSKEGQDVQAVYSWRDGNGTLEWKLPDLGPNESAALAFKTTVYKEVFNANQSDLHDETEFSSVIVDNGAVLHRNGASDPYRRSNSVSNRISKPTPKPPVTNTPKPNPAEPPATNTPEPNPLEPGTPGVEEGVTPGNPSVPGGALVPGDSAIPDGDIDVPGGMFPPSRPETPGAIPEISVETDDQIPLGNPESNISAPAEPGAAGGVTPGNPSVPGGAAVPEGSAISGTIDVPGSIDVPDDMLPLGRPETPGVIPEISVETDDQIPLGNPELNISAEPAPDAESDNLSKGNPNTGDYGMNLNVSRMSLIVMKVALFMALFMILLLKRKKNN